VATTLETTPELETASADREQPITAGPDRGPVLALGLIVVGSFALYTVLGVAVDVPRVHPDEVRYVIAASSLVEGEGLSLRGEDYGFGPLLALVLAAILRVAGSVDAAYDWFKAANALFFALAAVPVYLLARRLVSSWWAVLAAGLSVAIPSSISVGTVMTESLSYLLAAWSLYAIALALERPTVLRQLAVLAAIAAAFFTRPQFGILYATWVGALVLLWLLAPGTRPRTRGELVGLWPTALPVVVGVLGFVARLASGASARDSFGAYWELWRGYDPLLVAKWFVYHLGDFAVYFAVVPLAVAPVVLWQLGRMGRDGSRPAAAFVSLFAAANVSGLLVVAAFTSTPWGYDRLHDRYGFYLVPLWLLAFVVWLASGLPRPLLTTAAGALAAVVLVGVLPYRQLANEAGIDTVPGALWLWVEGRLAGPGPASGQLALALFVIALLGTALLVPRKLGRVALPALVATGLLASSGFAWERLIDAPEDRVFAGGLERAWIDRRLPGNVPVTKLYVDTPCGSTLERHALFLTEFFNETVDRAAYVGGSVPDGIQLERVDVSGTGTLELSPGNPLRADHVYTQSGVQLAGRRVAEGTAGGLVLWDVGGTVRVVGATSNGGLRRQVCG